MKLFLHKPSLFASITLAKQSNKPYDKRELQANFREANKLDYEKMMTKKHGDMKNLFPEYKNEFHEPMIDEIMYIYVMFDEPMDESKKIRFRNAVSRLLDTYHVPDYVVTKIVAIMKERGAL